MISPHKSCMFSFATGCLKFFLVFSIFGMIAICLMILSLSITNIIETKSLYTLIALDSGNLDMKFWFPFLIDGVSNAVPFGEIFEILVENEGSIFSGLFDFFTGLFNKEKITTAWSDYSSLFFRDMVIATLAGLFFFLFARLNKLLSIFKGFSAQLAFIIVSVLWLFSSYCVSRCIISLLEAITVPSYWNWIYFLILLISFLLHALLLGFSIQKEKSRIPRALVVLAIDIVFSGISALLLWLLKGYLYGLFRIFEVGRSMFAFFVVAFSLRFLESLKTIVLKKITFSFYSLFYQQGKSF